MLFLVFLIVCLCFSNQNAHAQAEKRPGKKPDLSPKKRLLRKYGKTKTDKYKGEVRVTKGKTNKSGKTITAPTRKNAPKTGISGLVNRIATPKKHKGVSGLIIKEKAKDLKQRGVSGLIVRVSPPKKHKGISGLIIKVTPKDLKKRSISGLVIRVEAPKQHKGVSGFVIRVSPNKITKREGSYKGVSMSLVNRHKKAINRQSKQIANYKGTFTYVDKRATLYARKGKQASTYKGFIRVRKRPYMATTHTYQRKNYSKPYDIRNLKKGLWLPKKGDMPRYMRQKVARPKADRAERQIWDTYAPNMTKRNTKLKKITNASGTNSTGMPQRINPKDLNKKDKNPLPR